MNEMKNTVRACGVTPRRWNATTWAVMCATCVIAFVLSAMWIGSPFVETRSEASGVVAEKLSVSRARRAIARTAGIELPVNAIEVEKEGISVLGSAATVEAKVKTAFRLRQVGDEWEVAEVRLGADRWEDVALLGQALDREKRARAQAELETLRLALEAFRRERGHYPPVATARELADHLSPRHLPRVLRLDPWGQPYEYAGAATGYRLRSAGADRKTGTADDIALGGAS